MRRRTLVLAAFAAAVSATTGIALPAAVQATNDRPALPDILVIGHRGASGYLPEHTLESYALATELGADCIEPDLVSTKDGVLIARHEPNLIGTTDVASRPEFASRRKSITLDGAPDSGFYASDFTLAEIRTLRAVQPAAERFEGVDGDFRIPTFDEVIALAKRKSDELDRTICIYPETKHPTYHASIGLPLEDTLVRTLKRAGWNKRNSPVFIQSFEQANLKYLNTITDVRLVQLVDANDVNADGSLDFTAPYDRPYDWTVAGRTDGFQDLLTPAGLAEVATYADGVGPWKPYLISSALTDANGDGTFDDLNGDGALNDADRKLLAPTSVIADAHAAGLLVHPYTFRNEQRRLASNYAGEPAAEYRTFYAAGVDGLFSDFPETAFVARTQFLLDSDASLARCLTGSRGRWLDRCDQILPSN